MTGSRAGMTAIRNRTVSRIPMTTGRAIRTGMTGRIPTGSRGMATGIPVTANGSHPAKAADSRYVHRGPFLWEEAALRHTPGTIQQKIFEGLQKMEQLRGELSVFTYGVPLWMSETWEPAVLCLIRQSKKERLVSLFNFSDQPKTAWIKEEGEFEDLLTGEKQAAQDVPLKPYEMKWMLRKF